MLSRKTLQSGINEKKNKVLIKFCKKFNFYSWFPKFYYYRALYSKYNIYNLNIITTIT